MSRVRQLATNTSKFAGEWCFPTTGLIEILVSQLLGVLLGLLGFVWGGHGGLLNLSSAWPCQPQATTKRCWRRTNHEQPLPKLGRRRPWHASCAWGAQVEVVDGALDGWLVPQGSTSTPHWGFTGCQPRSLSASHNLRASLRRMRRRVFRSGGAPVSGRPESTKYIGSPDQLLGSQWNRAAMLLTKRANWCHVLYAHFSITWSIEDKKPLGLQGLDRYCDQGLISKVQQYHFPEHPSPLEQGSEHFTSLVTLPARPPAHASSSASLSSKV